MDHALLDILVCPACKGKLLYDHSAKELICRFDRLAYPVRNQVPVMIESEARQCESSE
ncbi:MAG: tetraacyldisaccharide 4'-kinase [Gammaproteobacteria bacterium RIFCSPLOWO2_02_FULL_42_14]|nr:MAG: tetraacyldisaccharide 4'-kinase [Gammaproteobacteria bacterium RIFCSPHIGHO2_02_FULL_42_43]OGT29182.1 MAG: tetraacyldisaccharide 4'-kinase [Gammaproteobacteria bacterium RIFCSPHIGHO2_01_FULL_42_8]OGT51226.1 MAG: tetraacyldisaccharide 4'-kinase [Gammaproteobacteria bacterium RIFCSPHIGHO2_12_FULL_41_25]OGT62987.1 MAG: tetraacyldisaccharide 4'-kinase [Gammaproteobacteria bacterium RIFCSPLOWO2_02_FULL_42_14]OGT86119.1 MAG: tetraacyldisaccharide 4'-kinase [Gammaproteobacteria bacterium RIFCSP